MRTLVVDDSNFIREYMRQLLQRMGISVVEAVHGEAALMTLKVGAEFDLMLIDVNMPVMGGLQCLRKMREAGLGVGMKVMMVTTEADHGFINEALESGADEFLMKPFTPQSLQEKLALLGFDTAA